MVLSAFHFILFCVVMMSGTNVTLCLLIDRRRKVRVFCKYFSTMWLLVFLMSNTSWVRSPAVWCFKLRFWFVPAVVLFWFLWQGLIMSGLKYAIFMLFLPQPPKCWGPKSHLISPRVMLQISSSLMHATVPYSVGYCFNIPFLLQKQLVEDEPGVRKTILLKNYR